MDSTDIRLISIS